MLGLNKLYRRIKLVFAAPHELELLRSELTQAVRARERAHEEYDRRLSRSQTMADESKAREVYRDAQSKERRAVMAVSLARTDYLRTGVIDTDRIRRKVAPSAKSPKPHYR